MTDFISTITARLNLRASQVSAAVELLDAGNTIPFIARYRKEQTGTLDEEQLRQTADLLDHLRALDERRQVVLESIEEQGKLTGDLRKQIEAAASLTELEDLYAPYRPKRRTRASIAREKGLQGLADLILQQAPGKASAEEQAKPYLNENVETVEDALAGARDIVAETISDHAGVRSQVRTRTLQFGVLRSARVEGAEDERGVYENYYEWEQRIDRLRPHQVLALDRGESETTLRIAIITLEQDWMIPAGKHFQPDRRSPFAGQMEQAAADAAERLLLPAIERDVRRTLTERAGEHAIAVFSANLRALLSQPPLAGQTVLGIDPGFRTGCKVAVVDPTGRLLDTTTIYPHAPQKKWAEALQTLRALVEKHRVTLITIGNGTASRESELLAAELIRDNDGVRYLIVNEAGASVYSASPLARAELPGQDVSLRGAVSIARRAQDPLAELVKIDPKSIGVGLYQHDVDQTALGQALDGVVESAVNQVGVDANTASPALLAHVAGIGPKLADKIVARRDETGPFRSRAALRHVPGLGPKAFEQSAGFLRIRDGENPLDASAIHPESYPAAIALLEQAGLDAASTPQQRQPALEALLKRQPVAKLAAGLGVGEPTLTDIFEQLIRPGRDPRADLPAPILRSDVLSMDDLSTGMRLKGTVRNVVDFGAFVDIGVKQDGLLHRSQIPAGTALQVGDIIDVEVIKIEAGRGRIALKMPGG